MAMSCMLLLACSKKTTESSSTPEIPATSDQIKLRMVGGTEEYALPNATIFRMNGDYADHVAVTLRPDGTLAYYPAPTDIMANSAPYDLGNGWWLNRQGISSNSVFTKWTFDEYHALKTVPSQQEIIDAIIPGARVEEMRQIPVSLSDALYDPGACRKYVP